MLVVCAQLTAQAVSEGFGVDIGIALEVIGDLDLRGTHGIDPDVRVEFEDIRLNFTVDGKLDADTKPALRKVTVRYCPVFQTLVTPPDFETTWNYQ